MRKDEDGNLIITKETQEITKEVLATLGFVFVTTRVIYMILTPTRTHA